MSYCIITTNKWTDSKRIHPVIYSTEQEAKKIADSWDKTNNTYEVRPI